jgi:outer membrane protein
MFKKSLFVTSALAISVMSSFASDASAETEFNSFTDLSSWQVRLRAVTVSPDESSTVSNGSKVNAKPVTVPEIDFTYFITKNVAAELILATNRHDMYAGATDLGHVKLLPPTLTLQYHFMPEETFRPYVGAGVNYTFFYDSKPGAGLNSVDYDDGFGYALQVGADYMLDENWGINFDVKKVYLNTDVSVNNGAVTADVDLDPWIIGTGITYKF